MLAAPPQSEANPIEVLHAAARQAVPGDRVAVRPVYLRRKPGRGLVAVYRFGTNGMVTATRPESGGVSVDIFPSDSRLPALAGAFEARAGGILAEELALRLGAAIRIDGVVPVRYKPGARCVLSYDVTREGLSGPERWGVFGKLYADERQAVAADSLARRLWSAGVPVPRPMGLIPELGMVLSERIGGPETRPGPTVLRGPGLPGDGLAAAAELLAYLHGISVTLADGAVQSTAAAAERVRQRAAGLAVALPDRATVVDSAAERLARALASADCSRSRTTHGAFKPSQLVFAGPQVYLTDLDAAGPADPAGDVGYFLAYLHPPGYWYGERRAQNWYRQASAVFADSYHKAMRRQGTDADEIARIDERSRLYAAATLLKIAARRFHRLQSPRPGEVAAMLDRIHDEVDRFHRLNKDRA